MSLELLKQMLGMLLIFVTILLTVVAINEKEYVYLLYASVSAIISYLLIHKK